MTNELDALDPSSEQLKLSTGAFIELEALRSRQFFKLLRIVTHGALPMVRDFSVFRFSADMDPVEFGTRLLSLMVMSIPDAEEETLEFIRSMCKPVGLIERRGMNKADVERNTELWVAFEQQLQNPEIDDLITIVEAIVRREAADIQALGKRLTAMFKIAEKTGQVPSPPSQTSPEPTSSAASPEPSTSSPASTAGRTTRSRTSRSNVSDNASQPSENAVSGAPGSANNG